MFRALLPVLVLAVVAGIALLVFFFKAMITASIMALVAAMLVLDTSDPTKLWISGAFFIIALSLFAFNIWAAGVAAKKAAEVADTAFRQYRAEYERLSPEGKAAADKELAENVRTGVGLVIEGYAFWKEWQGDHKKAAQARNFKEKFNFG